MKKVFYSIFAIAALSIVSCGAQEGETETEGENHGETTETPAAISGTYNSGEGASVTWKAKHNSDAEYVHVGTVPTSGNVVVDNNMIMGGEFTFDLNKIDEEGDSEWNQKLEGHLKAEDLFNVAVYPSAKFTITGSEEGKVMGKLEVLGVSQDVTIEGTFNVTENEVTVQGSTKVDMLAFQLPFLVQASTLPEEEKAQAADPIVVFDMNLTLTK